MIQNKTTRMMQLFFIILIIFTVISLEVSGDFPRPNAPNNMTNYSTQAPEPTGGFMVNTSGGTINYYNINTTTQNPHWKAYVGNISGAYALQDSNGNSIYNWSITTLEGEIYATRNASPIDWNSVTCADVGEIRTEEVALNMSADDVDNIVNTFDNQTHPEFYAGLVKITENSCNSTNLYVNGQESADFFQILLHDTSNIVHAGLLEDSVTGFDGIEYDFELMLPESGLEGEQESTPYYFYVELT